MPRRADCLYIVIAVLQNNCANCSIAAMKQTRLSLLTSPDWTDYELLDSGHLQKFERFGRFRFIRPEPQAMWQPRLDLAEWQADGVFVAGKNSDDDNDQGRWQLAPNLPDMWDMGYQSLRFLARPTPFRHLGFFPEQAAHWDWCATAITRFIARHQRPPLVLNLFAYSGLASLHAAAAGAEVTHLDASKKAVAQAFENRDMSGMSDAPIRFITDDATGFVDRELRRGRRYDGIILDPPKYGRGPKGEFWKIEDHLIPLLQKCRALLSDDPLFLVLTIYAIRASSLAAHYALADTLAGCGGHLESGELALQESPTSADLATAGRFVAQANFARWQAD
jgi:23S rRNA (cytosine1962-C5)-methyltransferase